MRMATLRAAPASSEAPIDPRESENSSDESEEGFRNGTRRKFCPAVDRQLILTMLEKHYCTHPFIPGYAHPSPDGI
jgi:hypothetical protein